MNQKPSSRLANKIFSVILFLSLLVSHFGGRDVIPVNAQHTDHTLLTNIVNSNLDMNLNTASLQDFYLLSAHQGWLLFNNNLYWTENDWGKWKKITPTNIDQATIKAVSFIDKIHGWLILNYPAGPFPSAIEQTTDGGITWHSTPLELFKSSDVISPSDAIYMQWLNPQIGWLVVKQSTSSNFSLGSLFKTTDGGKNWKKLTIPLGEPVYFVNENVGWVAGGPDGESLYRTLDGGLTWQNQTVELSISDENTTVFYQLPKFDSLNKGVLPVIVKAEIDASINFYSVDINGSLGALLYSMPIKSDFVGQENIPLKVIDSNRLVIIPSNGKDIFRINEGTDFDTITNKDNFSGIISELDMSDISNGWAKLTSRNCIPTGNANVISISGIKTNSHCVIKTQLLQTQNGGINWVPVVFPETNLNVIEESIDIASDVNRTSPSISEPSISQSFVGQGFDSCVPPTLTQMQDWWNNSPYYVWNLYIGGSSRGCNSANQAAITNSFVSQLYQQGWKFIPTWVGPQASCSGYVHKMSSDPATAYSQGVNEANSAGDTATNLGLSGTVIYYDLEGYDTTNTGCRNAAKSFISGWTAQLHSRGYQAGAYGSSCASALSDFISIANVPDAIWPANWNYSSYNSNATVWSVSCISNNYWSNHQRIRQYAGGHSETWGNTTLNIDSDVIDGLVAVPSISSCPTVSGTIRLFDGMNCSVPSVDVGLGLSQLESATYNFNDKTESIALPSGWSARLYLHNSESSPSVCVASTDNDLSDKTFSDGTVVTSNGGQTTWIRVYNNSGCTGGAPPNPPAPDNPANGQSFNEGEAINLSWTATGSEYYGEVWGGPAGTTYFDWQSGTSKNIGSQWAGYIYTWRVKARNSNGTSDWSFAPTFIVRPGAPSNLNAAAISCSQINLSWSDNSGSEEGYKVYRYGNLIATLVSGATNYSNTGLAANTNYSYVVKAYRSNIESNSSNTSNATTGTCPVNFPQLMLSLGNNLKNRPVDIVVRSQNAIVFSSTRQSDGNGDISAFSLNNVQPGTYTLLVKPQSWLQRVVQINIGAGSNSANLQDRFNNSAGDIQPDNSVNILDFQLLSNDFAQSVARSDLNGDGSVNILDFQLLSNGFGETGEGSGITNLMTDLFNLGSSKTFTAGAAQTVAEGWTTTGSMGSPRWYHTATVLLNGKVLVTGGYNTGALASAELYDPSTGTWLATGSMTTPRFVHTATLLPNGKVLVAGGLNASWAPLASTELYDPATGHWTALSSMGAARSSHSATLLSNGKVLVVAGAGPIGTGALRSAELYDPSTNVWAPTGQISIARSSHSATLLSTGKVLIAGGLGTAALSSSELYTPATGSWVTTGAMTSVRVGHTATLLSSGKVLVAGAGSTIPLATSELYDPNSGNWAATGSLSIPRGKHAAIALANGKVLVSGGWNVSAGGYLPTVQLYTLGSGAWTTTDSLLRARSDHQMVLLQNGKVLMIGGNSGSGILASAETYTPPNVDIFIGRPQASYYVPAHVSLRLSFAGVNNGPVKITNTGNISMIAAERVIYKVNNINTSFTEMMGLPNSQLNTTYWLPWYNNVDLDTQLRIANVSGSQATVTITIGGVTQPSFNLAAGASTRVSYPVNNGPVKIVGTQNLVAAERVIYKVNGVNTSFSELMALPNSQLSTTYWLPWYNNVDMDTQLRFGNVSTSTATVRVYIGGQEMTGSPFTLTPGASTRASFPGIKNGPVKIVSNVNIVAAERVIYKANGVNTSFTEMMALPNSQLNTVHWLPWYNNAALNTQLRISNVSTAMATVHVYIGGQEMTGSPFNLAPGASVAKAYAGVDRGPVKIVSTQTIVVSEPILYRINNVNTSFTEMMGLPDHWLNATYWLPWYNNVDLDTQLRFGVP